MADIIDAEQATNLLKALGELKSATVWAVVVIAAIVVAYLLVRAWLGHAAEGRVERRKEARQKQYLAAIQSLGKDMRAHADADTAAMHIIQAAMSEIRKALEAIRDKQEGKVEFEPSLKLMCVFMDSIAIEASAYFARSLEENDYENRKSLIASKMKTSCADLIEDALSSLAELELAFDPNVFFRVYEDPANGGTRYILCDVMWLAVEPLYRRHGEPLKNRLEEMRLALANAVKDQYTKTARNLTDKQSQRKRHRRVANDGDSSQTFPVVQAKVG